MHKACTSDTVVFHNLSDSGQYFWSFGDMTLESTVKDPTHIYQNQNIYVVRLKVISTKGCVDSVLKTVDVTHPLNAAFTQSADTVCLNAIPVVFTDASTGAANWNWNFGEGAPSILQNPSYTFTQAGGNHTIRLIISDGIPCYDTAYRQVQVDALPYFSIDLPNVFTPNGDGVNDYFYPRQLLSKGVVGFTMSVFNRWGQKVFESTIANGRGWDGKLNDKDQPMGVYIYQINAIMKNGRNENYTGNVTLMR